MKIKKYIVSNFNEGKKKILAELGENAVILSSRNIHKPESEETKVEIVAAIDEKEQIKTQDKKPVKEKVSGLDAVLDAAKQNKKSLNPNRAVNFEQKNDVYDEIYDIRLNINRIFDALKYKFTPSLNPVYGSILRKLIDNGFTEDYSLKILSYLNSDNSNITFEEVLELSQKKIIESIKIKEPIKKTSKTQIIAMVGPSGSGKTISLVKLSIILNLLGLKVLIVSADTHKVGGSEQLSTFSSIAGLPFKSAYNTKELKKIVSESNEFDLVFLDTKAISYRNSKDLYSVADMVHSVNPKRTILTLSANTNAGTIKEILDEFGNLKVSEILLTKLDESAQIGSLISLLADYEYPISYLTYGVEIPDDISPASARKLGMIALPIGKRIDVKSLMDEE